MFIPASTLIAAGAIAIAGSPDRPQSHYAGLAAPFAAVGALGGMGTGTLIDEEWVVTAAHVADFLRLRGQTPIVFTLDDGREFTVDRVVIHPSWKPLEQQMAGRGADDLFSPGDIALLHLSEAVDGVAPMALGAFDAESSECTIVGIGAFLAEPDKGASQRDAMGMTRGVKHAGTNRIDREDAERQELVLSFTRPDDRSATPSEASAFVGDSGGPLLSQTASGWTVIGVIGSIDTAGDTLGAYGDETHATSISAVRAWIDEQIGE